VPAPVLTWSLQPREARCRCDEMPVLGACMRVLPAQCHDSHTRHEQKVSRRHACEQLSPRSSKGGAGGRRRGAAPVEGSISLTVKRRMLTSLPSAMLPSGRRSSVNVWPTSPCGMRASGTTSSSSNSSCGARAWVPCIGAPPRPASAAIFFHVFPALLARTPQRWSAPWRTAPPERSVSWSGARPRQWPAAPSVRTRAAGAGRVGRVRRRAPKRARQGDTTRRAAGGRPGTGA
jgi:hypothetical protein